MHSPIPSYTDKTQISHPNIPDNPVIRVCVRGTYGGLALVDALCQLRRHAEVGQLALSGRADQDVGRLQVPMDLALGVQVLQTNWREIYMFVPRVMY